MASNESAVLFDQPGPKGRKTIRIVNWIAGIIFPVVVVLILMRLHNPPDGENQLSWELWKPALDAEAWTDFYLPGLWATIRASVLAVVGAVVFGLVFGVGRLLPSLLIRTISGAIVEFARAVPVLLLALLLAACSKEPENTPQAPASAAQGAPPPAASQASAASNRCMWALA